MTGKVGRALYGGTFATEEVPPGSLPFVLPGELLEADGTGLVRILEPSARRVEPRCVHFGSCGGCQYQHADYAEQLRMKETILGDLFASAGLSGLPAPTVHAADPWEYRNRIRLRVRQEAGGVEVGYSRRGTNEFLPVRMCPIAVPVLWRAAEAMIRLGTGDAVCARWLGSVSEVELFTVADESRVQMQFFLGNSDVARQKGQSFAEFCERLRDAIPELAGAGAALDPELGRRARKAWDGAEWGAAGLGYAAAGRTYWVSRGAFFQVNRFQVDRLVEQVTGEKSGALAWDLYAGVGLFSRALAETFVRVVALEGGEAAAADLLRVSAKGTKALQAVRSPTVEFLRAAVTQRERPELVVLDPPRAGLGVEGSELLSRIGAGEVVYVSCDPVTLARDLAVLLARGYHVEKLDLVDLFPQTFHLETVVQLRRG